MAGTFIRMPWDDDGNYRWSSAELAEARALRGRGLNWAEIADHLSELGYPARDDTAVCQKLRPFERVDA